MTDVSKIGPADPVKMDCLAAMTAAQISRNVAAKQIGVSAATLSLWIAGEYKGDNARVERLVENWLRTRSEGAALSVRDAGLDIHRELETTDDIMATLAHAQEMGDIVLIHGVSGAGKSWAAQHYCETHSAAFYLPVSCARRTMTGLLEQIATALGVFPARHSAADYDAAIIEFLMPRSALLIIDEAHHLPALLLDELRCIRDQAGCGVAYIGDASIKMKLARCPQILGRIACRLERKAPAAADVAVLVSGVLGRPAEPHEIRTAMVAATSPGGLHALRRLLERAWMTARVSNREEIFATDLEAAIGHVVDIAADRAA